MTPWAPWAGVSRELSNNRQHALLAVVDFQVTDMHLFCT